MSKPQRGGWNSNSKVIAN